jgi:hypothetical protein
MQGMHMNSVSAAGPTQKSSYFFTATELTAQCMCAAVSAGMAHHHDWLSVIKAVDDLATTPADDCSSKTAVAAYTRKLESAIDQLKQGQQAAVTAGLDPEEQAAWNKEAQEQQVGCCHACSILSSLLCAVS